MLPLAALGLAADEARKSYSADSCTPTRKSSQCNHFQTVRRPSRGAAPRVKYTISSKPGSDCLD